MMRIITITAALARVGAAETMLKREKRQQQQLVTNKACFYWCNNINSVNMCLIKSIMQQQLAVTYNCTQIQYQHIYMSQSFNKENKWTDSASSSHVYILMNKTHECLITVVQTEAEELIKAPRTSSLQHLQHLHCEYESNMNCVWTPSSLFTC